MRIIFVFILSFISFIVLALWGIMQIKNELSDLKWAAPDIPAVQLLA